MSGSKRGISFLLILLLCSLVFLSINHKYIVDYQSSINGAANIDSSQNTIGNVVKHSTSDMHQMKLSNNTIKKKSNNTYYALIADQPNQLVERTNNRIHLVKYPEEKTDIVITLDGGFGGPNLRSAITTLKLKNPRGNTITTKTFDNEGPFSKTLTISQDKIPGHYTIDVRIDTKDSQSPDYGCCFTLNYKISYSGLSVPPYVEGIGNDFGFSPDHGWIPIRNRLDNLHFYSYLQNKDYMMLHQPWGSNDVVEGIIISFPDGTKKTLNSSSTHQDGKFKFEFLAQKGIHGFEVLLNPDQEHRIIGFKLTEQGNIKENALQIIPLAIGNGTLDSDFDLLPDINEEQNGTSYLNPDTDDDYFDDYIEVKMKTSPSDKSSLPIQVNGSFNQNDNEVEVNLEMIKSEKTNFNKINYTIRSVTSLVSNPQSKPYGELVEFKDFVNNTIKTTFTFTDQSNDEIKELTFRIDIGLFLDDIPFEVYPVTTYSTLFKPISMSTNDVANENDTNSSLEVDLGFTRINLAPIPYLIVIQILVMLSLVNKYHSKKF